MSRKPFWRLSPFVGLFGDPYIEGTELEAGHFGTSLAVVDHIIGRVINKFLQDGGAKRLGLDILNLNSISNIKMIKKIFTDCAVIVNALLESAESPSDTLQVIKKFVGDIKNQKIGERILIPGGWFGLTSMGGVLHIIERVADNSYSFITCNSGSGREYHPSTIVKTEDNNIKLKYKTCLRIDGIPLDRISDIGYWTLSFSQWIKQSEYHRVEVIYDVLLPWMASSDSNRLVGECMLETKDDKNATFKTPSRSNTSGFQSVFEGLIYLLRSFGFSKEQYKRLLYVIRKEFIIKSVEEVLRLIEDRNLPSFDNLVNEAKNLGIVKPEKPEEASFSLQEVIQSVPGIQLIDHNDQQVGFDKISNKYLGVYFSAHWCPPCQKFTPILCQTYNAIKQKTNDFEIIMISADRSEAEFKQYFQSMPWIAVDFKNVPVRRDISRMLNPQSGIPCLVFFDKEGKHVTSSGVEIVMKDPSGEHFPWGEVKQEEFQFESADFWLLRTGCKQLSLASLKRSNQNESLEELTEIHNIIELIEKILAQVSKPNLLENVPPVINPELLSPSEPYSGFSLLAEDDVEKYSGKSSPVKPASLINLLDVPTKVNSLQEIIATLIKCDSICDDLLLRGKDGSTSTRIVFQMQIISLIGYVFTEVIPIPKPLNSNEEDVWKTGLNQAVSGAEAMGADVDQVQILCLQRIHKLTLTYAAAWQSIDTPPRDFDSERTIVAAAMISIFDIALRTISPISPLILSELLWEDGGYFISNTVCQDNRTFEEVSNWMEITKPQLVITRNEILHYFSSLSKVCRHSLFDLRMPNKIEFKKYGNTVQFLRKFLERCGYELIPRDNPNPPPEMEALMEWMLSDRTALAQDHPEFHMMRDMALLFKFLATMETRDAELLRRREEQRLGSWRLSFEETSTYRSFWKSSQLPPLRWEAVGFRGQDMDTADVSVDGFGGREIFFGEGPVVHSPTNVSLMLDIPHPTEDDILHFDKLPTFGNTISREESELLLSYLTVDYLRIPLIVSFFAAQDRVNYLFNSKLQSLLRSVLFEAGPWTPKINTSVENIPLRKNAAQIQKALHDRLMFANYVEEMNPLGTQYGLLVNELRLSPNSIMPSIIEILYSIKELTRSSVYSPDACFIFYMIELAVDIEHYVVFVINLLQSNEDNITPLEKNNLPVLLSFRNQLREYLHGIVISTLEKYEEEANRENDIPTLCVLHTFMAMLWTSTKNMSKEFVEAILLNICFVRNWHGFGLGQLRSDMMWTEEDSEFSPEQRLLRFLQSRGIDTSRLTSASLEQYISSSSKQRPLFLHLGRDTIRVPTLVRVKVDDENQDEKNLILPPANLPEHRVFSLLQIHRRSIVHWLDGRDNETLDELFGNIVREALRSKDFEYKDWKKLGKGGYLAEKAELKIDAQTAEILWKNDELKPIPDSMTQYAEYITIFGKEPLHCGVVKRDEHRFWIHIVGTPYDLIEWDEPQVIDQGLGTPAPFVEKSVSDDKICLRCGSVEGCWICKACTFANCGLGANVRECAVCQTPKDQQLFGAKKPKPKVECESVTYNKVLYNRKFDPYSEQKHPVVTEEWVVDILQPILLALYSPPDNVMKYSLLFPQEHLPEIATEATLIGCVDSDQDDATWKEVVVSKTRAIVQVFNLVSSGRRLFRSLVYSSNAKYCLHSLPPSLGTRSEATPKTLRNAAGDFKIKRKKDSSLVVIRKNTTLGGFEIYLAPKLLQGLIPSSLLESFHFWQGEDKILRGEPVDSSSQWFNYNVEVSLTHTSTDNNIEGEWVATIKRRPLGTGFTQITSGDNKKGGLLRKSESNENNMVDVASLSLDINVMQLINCFPYFSLAACRLALQKNYNIVEEAAAWLLDDSNRAEVLACEMSDTQMAEDPVVEIPLRTSINIEPTPQNLRVSLTLGKIQLLEDEGFSHVASQYALELFGGDSDLAFAWLRDEDNALQIAMLDEKHGSGESIEMDEDTPASEKHVYLTLLNLLNTDAVGTNTFLHRIATALSRIEDLSHILVWSTSQADLSLSRSTGLNDSMQIDSDLCKISVIELPRLKLKFQPKKDSDNIVRLYLLDHAGWYVTDSVSNSPQFSQLLRGIDNCLVLEDQSHDLQVMVANHDVFRPRVIGDPFATQLIFDRGSLGWQQVMESRVYLYPVHTSKTFLLTRTLSSTLYLILLKFLNRDYESAFYLIEGCCIDTQFTAEDQWVFDQFEKTLDDLHPNAHACRLKLSVAVLYSKNKCKWEVHQEMDRYLAKLNHVSASCRITLEEEIDLLHQCKQATTRIKNRLDYLQALNNNIDIVTLQPEQPKIAGQPWIKLITYTLQYLDMNGTQISRLHYKKPEIPLIDRNDPNFQLLRDQIPTSSDLKDEKCLEIISNDLLLSDEESGSNRQLGFLFLYDLLRNNIKLSIGNTDCTKSLGELFTRYFHLKLSRWGKEQQEHGEQEAAASRQMAWLAAVIQNPQAHWPDIPADPESKFCLKIGINLYSIQQNRNKGEMLRNFLKFFDEEFKDVMFSEKHSNFVALQKFALNQIHNTKFSVETKVDVAESELFNPPEISDFSCERLQLKNLNCNSAVLTVDREKLDTFAKSPLKDISFAKYVAWEETGANIHQTIPFNLTNLSVAKTVVASDMLNRLSADVVGYYNTHNNSKIPRFANLTTEDILCYASDSSHSLEPIINSLNELIQALQDIQESDSAYIDAAINYVITNANTVNLNGQLSKEELFARYKYLLYRYANQRSLINTNFITAVVLSTKATQDLTSVNPFIQNSKELLDITSIMMLYCNRICHANRTCSLAKSLQQLVKQLEKGSQNISAIKEKLLHLSTSLADSLISERHYIKSVDNNLFYDPRFLVFEYVFDLLLRKRQVEIVESFVDSCKKGESRVQQMIMGAGKTTVVGPLLALILADGNTLVTQVMPSALLEQSRNILRSRFSNIITKRVYTLDFDRSCEDSVEVIAELYAKINSAKKHRSVVCASPEAIKSLMLKFIEQLHTIEKLDLNSIIPSESSRFNREVIRLRDQMTARSDMSDALVKIIELWQSGVLIMDEVDVLLHPLRSELNFPIGHKQPIDLSGFRWDLPIHIIDAIFFCRKGEVCENLQMWEEQEKLLGFNAKSILEELREVINKGYELHAMQRNPHLVLLDLQFYHFAIKPVITKWSALWLYKNFVGQVNVDLEVILAYISGTLPVESIREKIDNHMLPESIKLLNLASNWVKALLPHVLSKINRVSYGILTAADEALVDPRCPKSRLMMAVPFVGKDVPSRSSEFAHPDVLIGLTILSYRYEGMRKKDLKSLVTQLKQDFSRQVGPRDKRSSFVMFNEWLRLSSTTDENLKSATSVLPLPLFQPTDRRQLAKLYTLIRRIPQVVHYFLRQHVFPACMNFQQLKISACGHELGSSILFSKRIGFSGTPSNLLPMDLGDCIYEPGSDGQVINVLTSQSVTTAEVKYNWNARSLLKDIATSEPPFHALIDTGALITGMDNEEVAKYLLNHLPTWMEGVVYLDRQDRQMILLRSSGRSVNLAQCGINPERRFTFYDQIHTTGMDIKHATTAKAVITIGKDMTYRDYAQGAYRMRGIGIGQTIHLFIIPEVQNRIETDLRSEIHSIYTGKSEFDVPAWLLINSMRMENLQFIQMSNQELHNVWRKFALNSLLNEVKLNAFERKESSSERLRRFSLENSNIGEVLWLRKSINQFREIIGFDIEDHVPVFRSYNLKVLEKIEANVEFIHDNKQRDRINSVSERFSSVLSGHEERHLETSSGSNLSFNAEVVHENEQEAEEEEQKEAEEEEQKVSAFSRDDEQHNPWSSSLLCKVPSLKLGDEAFYQFLHFHVRDEHPKIQFPPYLLLSDNYFRPRWVGLGDRRLKNISVILELAPQLWQEKVQFNMKVLATLFFQQLMKGCGNEECSNSVCASNKSFEKVAQNVAFAKSITFASEKLKGLTQNPLCDSFEQNFANTNYSSIANVTPRYLVAVSLAEAETLRKLIHVENTNISKLAISLRFLNGRYMDQSINFVGGNDELVSVGVQCMRFINCEMYFSDSELLFLEKGLSSVSLKDRLEFFSECLRLRRRERNLWTDTPLAKIFTPQEEWHLLRTRSKLEQVKNAITKAIKERRCNPIQAFARFDADGDGYLTYEEVQRIFEWMQLGFSPRDYYEVICLADTENIGY